MVAMDDIEWLSKDEALINGWVFNFVRMRAVRHQWTMEMWNGHLKYSCSTELVSPGNWYHLDVYSKRIGKSMGYDDYVVIGGYVSWTAFFAEPEDRFNSVIDDAYMTWCLEQALC